MKKKPASIFKIEGDLRIAPLRIPGQPGETSGGALSGCDSANWFLARGIGVRPTGLAKTAPFVGGAVFIFSL